MARRKADSDGDSKEERTNEEKDAVRGGKLKKRTEDCAGKMAMDSGHASLREDRLKMHRAQIHVSLSDGTGWAPGRWRHQLQLEHEASENSCDGIR